MSRLVPAVAGALAVCTLVYVWSLMMSRPNARAHDYVIPPSTAKCASHINTKLIHDLRRHFNVYVHFVSETRFNFTHEIAEYYARLRDEHYIFDIAPEITNLTFQRTMLFIDRLIAAVIRRLISRATNLAHILDEEPTPDLGAQLWQYLNGFLADIINITHYLPCARGTFIGEMPVPVDE